MYIQVSTAEQKGRQDRILDIATPSRLDDAEQARWRRVMRKTWHGGKNEEELETKKASP